MAIRNNHRKLLAATAIAAAMMFTPSATAQEGNQLVDRKAEIMEGQLGNASFNARAQIAEIINQRRGRSLGASAELEMTREYEGRNGRKHMRFNQMIDGLRVHGAYVKATIDPSGEVTHLIERTATPARRRLRITMNPDSAIAAATRENFGVGLADDFFISPPTAEKVVISREDGRMEEGYLVEAWSAEDNLLYHTLIDRQGRIVSNELRTAEDSYNIYVDHPEVSDQTIVQGPGSGNAESPIGWLSGSQTTRVIQGNNVSAYLDRNGNNVSDGGGTPVTDGNFLTNHLPFQSATVSDNQEVAVQNLFYLNNIIHDKLYSHGFTESVGNFQENNFGRGGFGGDSVNAEAQDGAGTNNANFATPSDGGNPRMQMFLWTLTNPGRDGDLDADIVWHEYGHGLTWRMIGNMSGPVSGAIGEGMSDVLAILVSGRDTVGEYSTNNPNGIRSAPYTNYSRTIGDFTGSSVHFDGEIYAATIWRLSELANAAGIDNDGLLDVIVDGMNFTPSGPDYLDMRDGLLASGDAAMDCLVWEAFSDFGMGDGAVFNLSGNQLQIAESFDVPTECGGAPPPPPPAGFSVANLSGASARTSFWRWSAQAVVTIVDENGQPASGVPVNGVWSTGNAISCITNTSGQCGSTLSGLFRFSFSSVNFTVTAVDGGPPQGSPLSITINRP